jgi:low affinity Fe/Cu permease
MSSEHPSPFDRFADKVNEFTAKAWFFAACVLIVLVWAPSILVFQSLDTWQLIINTTTTIVTFLLVALQQNAQTRADAAVQQKLNCVAEGVAALLHEHDEEGLARRLRHSVGLEDRESSS